MLIGNIYSVTAFVSFFLCAAILRCNNAIYERDNVIRKYFSFLLINFMIYTLIDTLWGFMNTKTFYPGRGVFYVVTLLDHLDLVFVAACWCIFLTCYFGFRESRMLMRLQCIPLLLAIVVLLASFVEKDVFVIDKSGAYHPGPYRLAFFTIQYGYYAITLIKVIYFEMKTKGERSLHQNALIIECATLPAAFSVMQYYYPDAPYASLGALFSSIIVFNGMMVMEKQKNVREYEMISRDNFKTLDALTDTFVVVLLIDIENDSVKPVKATPYADSFDLNSKYAGDGIKKVLASVAQSDYKDELLEFVNLDTLSERLEARRSVTYQYCSKEIGWCLMSFIAAERDEERNLKKVVLAIQSINDAKQKELEYENALSRAYKNENAILGELIKMQAVGMIASDPSSKIIMANDALIDMFGYTGEDPIGTNVFDFWDECNIKTPENARNHYDEIESRGGSFSYELVIQPKTKKDELRYLMADAKRIDLLDGTSVIATCFTDITEGKLLEDKLRVLSETDALTGIANRRCGESQIDLLLKEGVQGMFCLFDVDGFKKINDNLGHQTGDDTLVAVARAIRMSFRANDIFMRLGGDEFAIYMRGVVTPELAKIRIARLFENIARIELPGIPRGSVAISLGAVVVRAKDGVIEDDYASIYKRADAQMYKCKSRTGSNLSIEETKDEESEESGQLHQGKPE